MRRQRHTGCALLAMCSIAIASDYALAATSTVYKCFDKNLAVLYTDEPCKGEQLNIRAGDADPVAVAALQREREALSRSAAQRIADNRRAALDREYAAQWAYRPAEVLPPYADADVYYPAGYGFVPYSAAKRPRQPDVQPFRRFERERFVPNPPRGLPRR